MDNRNWNSGRNRRNSDLGKLLEEGAKELFEGVKTAGDVLGYMMDSGFVKKTLTGSHSDDDIESESVIQVLNKNFPKLQKIFSDDEDLEEDDYEEDDGVTESRRTVNFGHIGQQELTPAEECGQCDPADTCRTSGESMQETVSRQPDLKQAVLWAEILGDPVSVKRRKRRSEKLHGYQGYAGRR